MQSGHRAALQPALQTQPASARGWVLQGVRGVTPPLYRASPTGPNSPTCPWPATLIFTLRKLQRVPRDGGEGRALPESATALGAHQVHQRDAGERQGLARDGEGDVDGDLEGLDHEACDGRRYRPEALEIYRSAKSAGSGESVDGLRPIGRLPAR